MSVIRVLCRVVVGALFFGLVASCSQPPPPSAETAALEGSLLTVADVGGGFILESRGQVGVSGSGICPESEFRFDDVGTVRASFVWSVDDDEAGLVEMLRATEPGELDVLFPALRAAYDACYGVVWTDYGDTQTVEPMTGPEVGDDQIAVHALHGDPPFDGRHDDIRIVYVRSGNTFAEISVSEALDGAQDSPSVSDTEFSRIVEEAIAKLTG
jgi:hypothetical protein